MQASQRIAWGPWTSSSRALERQQQESRHGNVWPPLLVLSSDLCVLICLVQLLWPRHLAVVDVRRITQRLYLAL